MIPGVLGRKNREYSDEDINVIIRDSYNELLSRKEAQNTQMPEIGKYHPNIGILDEKNNLIPYEKFKELVLDSITSLEKSL